MARYSGVRRTERQQLNAPLKYTISGITFSWTASGAISRALRELQKGLDKVDKRTNAAKNLQAAMKRLEMLQKTISR
jgi:hypothetical protein